MRDRNDLSEEEITTYLRELHIDDLTKIILDEFSQTSYSVYIDMHLLIEFSPIMGYKILKKPMVNIKKIESVLLGLQEELCKEIDGLREGKVKENVLVRIEKLPKVDGLDKFEVPTSVDIGKLLSFNGIVIRMGANKILETFRFYKCTKCKRYTQSEADIESYNYIAKPMKCMDCGNGNLVEVTNDSEYGNINTCIDYQEIKVQEMADRKVFGSIPRNIAVILQNDLVDKARSGDQVTIVGIVLRRWKAVIPGQRPDISICMLASSIFVHNNNDHLNNYSVSREMKLFFEMYWSKYVDKPIRGRDGILAAICPQVYGLYIVKLALLLVMIGGTGKQSTDGLKVRGEMHLLLVGDPGTAKSQFLKYAAKLSPRSVLTTGVGTTSAGLTVAAVRDGGSGGEWMLEAGALVLADRGVCCIDEFSSIRENEKTAVHEVMEQQTISGAKAGMIINLNARCTIIAATNAKGKYDVNQSLSVNVGLASPLLSRFDLVLILSDNNDRDWDAKVADFILGLTTQKSKPEPLSLFSNSILESQSLFGFSQLQSYIQHVKARFNPTSTRESELILTTYYQFQRQKEFRSAARTTIRLLESLIRLSQAHARLMFRDKITKVDAVMAVYLMEFSNNNADALHINFPDNPDKFYRDTEKDILQKLGLTDQV